MDYRAAKRFIIHLLKTELPRELSYHGLHHTMDVLRVATTLCAKEKINKRDTVLVKTAALFHDAGFIKNKHANHEYESCVLAREHLKDFGYSHEDAEIVCGMIMATKIPQTPNTTLEQIICDADLDYLGRDDFYPIAHSLYEELSAYKLLSDEKTWNRLQISFLESHSFFTQTNTEAREPIKQGYIAAIKKIVSEYTD